MKEWTKQMEGRCSCNSMEHIYESIYCFVHLLAPHLYLSSVSIRTALLHDNSLALV
jgi:hypothetical protein